MGHDMSACFLHTWLDGSATRCPFLYNRRIRWSGAAREGEGGGGVEALRCAIFSASKKPLTANHSVFTSHSPKRPARH